MNSLLRNYPETVAGGFSRVDGTVQFYLRVQALLAPNQHVLEFGAGRGVGLQEDDVAARRALRRLSGDGRRIIGVDVDAAIMHHPALDEAHVIAPADPLPIATASVDIIIADYVFEHVADARHVAAELTRVLRPGGWLCARTPNKWSMTGMAIRAIPNRFHARLSQGLQGNRKAVDVFPTLYRLNSFGDLRKYFPPGRFDHATYSWEGEPDYVGQSLLLWKLSRLLFRLTPRPFRTNLFIFLRRKTD